MIWNDLKFFLRWNEWVPCSSLFTNIVFPNQIEMKSITM